MIHSSGQPSSYCNEKYDFSKIETNSTSNPIDIHFCPIDFSHFKRQTVRKQIKQTGHSVPFFNSGFHGTLLARFPKGNVDAKGRFPCTGNILGMPEYHEMWPRVQIDKNKH